MATLPPRPGRSRSQFTTKTVVLHFVPLVAACVVRSFMPLAHDDSPEKFPAAMTSLFASLVAASAVASNLAAGDFLKLGFTHILPYGLDHVLFVLSLFFCCRGFGELLGQVTLFTVAHSLSLGVAVVSGW